MALLLKIPTQPEITDQLFAVDLDDRPFSFRMLWNERFGYWSLSIAQADGTPILTNIKMVKDFELIQRFKSTLLPFDELYFVQENGNADRPGYGDPGVNFGLYYFEPDIAVTPQLVAVAAAATAGTIWDSGLTTWDGSDTTWDM